VPPTEKRLLFLQHGLTILEVKRFRYRRYRRELGAMYLTRLLNILLEKLDLIRATTSTYSEGSALRSRALPTLAVATVNSCILDDSKAKLAPSSFTASR
jgi:hypothetical protein